MPTWGKECPCDLLDASKVPTPSVLRSFAERSWEVDHAGAGTLFDQELAEVATWGS